MRLISQDGMIDVNYDNGSLVVGVGKYEECISAIITYYDHSCQKGTKLAEYSSKAKALKVMEMLRNAYCGLPIIMKNVDISDEVIELLKDLKKNGIIFQKVEENPSVEYVNNTYFKFPDDSEVEV